MGLTDKQKLAYYRNRARIDAIVLADARRDKHIIYGAKAINAQVPSFLQSYTEDFDIFSRTPKQDAYETERKLDAKFSGDAFSVKKGKYAGTWKVKSNVTKRTIADYTFPVEGAVPSVSRKGNKYARLSWIRSKLSKSIKDPRNAYRFEKDSEALQRIALRKARNDFLFS